MQTPDGNLVPRISAVFFFALIFTLITPVTGYAADIKGAKDHPAISRYDGASITGYQVEKFQSYGLLIGPVSQGDGKAGNPKSVKPLEGKVTAISYLGPEDRTTLEIFRNYEQELKADGYEVLYQCALKACGSQFHWTAVSGGLMIGVSEEQRYLAARKPRAEGDIYVSLYMNQNKAAGKKAARIQLDVIEVQPMQTGMVTVDATAMAKGIGEEGHIAIYGIYFDTDKAEIKPESKPSLDEIAKLLKKVTTLKLIIVGHTDNQGTLAYNMGLSKRRAAAVVRALTTQYGIAPARLQSQGVAFLAPVASNRNEAGRAKNRRVELVEF